MAFVNSFITSLLLLLFFIVASGAAIFLGITLRKSSDAKAEKAENVQTAEEA